MPDVEIRSTTQRIVVNPQTQHVSVIPAGPVGPPGVEGEPGPPGVDAETSVELVMAEHVADDTPHPAYDDMPDLTIHFENGLF